ncbi:hypothetical protein QL285_086603 [Trifolium repens]|nr:hypothetical protein QL285_086603 [Trifolium repens]
MLSLLQRGRLEPTSKFLAAQRVARRLRINVVYGDHDLKLNDVMLKRRIEKFKKWYPMIDKSEIEEQANEDIQLDFRNR